MPWYKTILVMLICLVTALIVGSASSHATNVAALWLAAILILYGLSVPVRRN